MSDSEVLSIRLPHMVKAKLEKLSKLSGRSKSWHAAEALDAYVNYQMPIVKGIVEAMRDGRAGKAIPHDEVVKRLNARLDTLEKKKKAKRV